MIQRHSLIDPIFDSGVVFRDGPELFVFPRGPANEPNYGVVEPAELQKNFELLRQAALE